MPEVYDLHFCFKGNRTYVHGTDIFNKSLTLFKQLGYKEIKKTDIVFHDIARKNLTFLPEDEAEKENIKVTFKFESVNGIHRFVAIENGFDVDCRYEYPEENIVRASIIDIENKTMTLEESLEFSFIEKIVAMNKGLLEKLFKDVDGKWFFTRLQLNELADNINMESKIILTFKSNFNFKLTKTVITVDDKEIGFIYFSLVKKGV